MRMLYWPLRSQVRTSKRLPGNAARSFSAVAASTRSSFKRAERSIPEKALTRLPAAKALVRLSRQLTITLNHTRELRVTSSVIIWEGSGRKFWLNGAEASRRPAVRTDSHYSFLAPALDSLEDSCFSIFSASVTRKVRMKAIPMYSKSCTLLNFPQRAAMPHCSERQ